MTSKKMTFCASLGAHLLAAQAGATGGGAGATPLQRSTKQAARHTRNSAACNLKVSDMRQPVWRHLFAAELIEMQSRLALTGKTFGGLVDKLRLSRFNETTRPLDPITAAITANC